MYLPRIDRWSADSAREGRGDLDGEKEGRAVREVLAGCDFPCMTRTPDNPVVGVTDVELERLRSGCGGAALAVWKEAVGKNLDR